MAHDAVFEQSNQGDVGVRDLSELVDDPGFLRLAEGGRVDVSDGGLVTPLLEPNRWRRGQSADPESAGDFLPARHEALQQQHSRDEIDHGVREHRGDEVASGSHEHPSEDKATRHTVEEGQAHCVPELSR